MLSYLCVGKSGHGKSSTLNSITNDDIFKRATDTTSGSKRAGLFSAQVGGQTLKIIDTPGLFDPTVDDDVENIRFARGKISEAFQIMKNNSIQHLDAILLVLSYINVYSAEEQKTISYLKTIFGPNFIRDNCVLLMTHGDNYSSDENNTKFPTFKDWCESQTGALLALFQECNFRIVLIDNNGSEMAKYDSAQEIFEYTLKMKSKYYIKHFQQQEKNRQTMLLTFCLDELKENMKKRLELLYEDFYLLLTPNENLDKMSQKFLEHCQDGELSVQTLENVKDSAVKFRQAYNAKGKAIEAENSKTSLRRALRCELIKELNNLYTAFEKLDSPLKTFNEIKAKTDLLLNEILYEAHGTAKLHAVENAVRNFQSKLVREASRFK
ncbi:GTPase IMAP family member 7-like [Physella acuta]|uniref:GTPase IMAP family member 7-like n=1 Tax=Physella acuta TaxID=109671 RepID=UPI0027DB4882|nr:GTPase IMAP family member 7-like [Physella acuta]XP_059175285.1 GTPase IMAP family member 7-like [Physella acuta]